MENTNNIGMRLDAYESTSFKYGVMINMTKLYSLMSV